MPLPRSLTIAAVLALAALAAGCGGSAGSSSGPRLKTPTPPASPIRGPDPRTAIVELVRGIDARDSRICTGLFTRRYIEQIGRVKGKPAIARCRAAIAKGPGTLKLEAIERVAVSGRRADVQYVSSAQGRAVRDLVGLKLRKRRWRIDVLKAGGPVK